MSGTETMAERLARLRRRFGEISPSEARTRQHKGALLLDVREDSERAAGMPEAAVGLSLGMLESLAGELLPDRDREIVTLCGSGRRSLLAAEALARQGYRHLSSVAGGFDRWQREGLPTLACDLDSDSVERYARQLVLPQVGPAGQSRLAEATVALVGAGGLGAPVSLYLAAAGVGRLRVIDDDRVERSNLHRQVIHADARTGMAKTDSARQSLNALNPTVTIDAHPTRLVADNVEALLGGCDVIVDGADNFPARYLINAASRRLGIPVVYGAVERFSGQASLFDPRDPDSPCYRCLFPEPPSAEDAPNCSEAGVLGVLPGLVGMIQATETLKLLLGIGEPLIGRLLTVDALGMRFRELKLPRDPHCPGCGQHARFEGYRDIEQICAANT